MEVKVATQCPWSWSFWWERWGGAGSCLLTSGAPWNEAKVAHFIFYRMGLEIKFSFAYKNWGVCMCVCVWGRERERERERECVCLCERVHACVCVFERERENLCICMYVCIKIKVIPIFWSQAGGSLRCPFQAEGDQQTKRSCPMMTGTRKSSA